MIDPSTKIGTLCRYYMEPKIIVKYEGDTDDIDCFIGTVIDSDSYEDTYAIGRKLNDWIRDTFYIIPNDCDHEYVNYGFNTIKMVCKFCDKEQ